MQLNLPLRTNALRCITIAGRCILHLPPTQIQRNTRSQHRHSTEKETKDEEESTLDPIILKFQQILTRPPNANSRFKRPYPKTKKGKDKGLGNYRKGPYRPFERESKGSLTRNSEISTNVLPDLRLSVEERRVDERINVCDKEKRTGGKEEEDGRINVCMHGEKSTGGKEEEEERIDIFYGEKGGEGKEGKIVTYGENREVERRISENEGREMIRESDEWTEEIREEKEREMCTVVNGSERRNDDVRVREEVMERDRNEEVERRGKEVMARNEGRVNTKEGTRKEEVMVRERNIELESRGNEVMKREKKEGIENTEERTGKEVIVRERNEGRENIEDGTEVLSERVKVLLSEIISQIEEGENRTLLKQCLSHNIPPAFDLLRRVCAAISKTPSHSTIRNVQELSRLTHPDSHLEHLGLDYYLASSLCRDGKVEESLSILLHLHRHIHPHRHKKVSDITQLVLYRLVLEEEGEEVVEKAVEFVDTVVQELDHLGPALSLWSALFTSPLYRMHQVSQSLLDRHPKLIKSLCRRVEGLVERAAWCGDLELLQRLLHLLLHYQMEKHYRQATSALLQLQCDMGDLRGAEETIKFAQKLSIRVTPSSLHRLLALLNHNRRPAPLALLALKYMPPPPPIPKPKPPPSHKYKF